MPKPHRILDSTGTWPARPPGVGWLLRFAYETGVIGSKLLRMRIDLPIAWFQLLLRFPKTKPKPPFRSSSPPIVCLRKCVMVAAADFYLFIYCLFLLGNAAILIGCLKMFCSVLVSRCVGYEAKKASQYFVFEFIMT